MTNQEKLSRIVELLEAGKTITITSRYSILRITPKAYRRAVEAGHEVFAATDHHLLVRTGKRFESINGCRVSAS